jgi:Cdc6-like AAA superfamily ATPase
MGSEPAIPPDERETLAINVGAVFTPSAPVNRNELFAGRTDQLRRVLEAINQRGQHVIIYGERGVGKTSLANILSVHLHVPAGVLLAPHVTCEAADDYSSLWRKVFTEIELTRRIRAIGFHEKAAEERASMADNLPDRLTTGDVRNTLRSIAPTALLVVIIDEFDRLSSHAIRASIADTIKVLSDHSSLATLVLVGVADTIDELIKEHASVERALVQVPMPRMSKPELEQLIMKGLDSLGMQITPAARNRIATLSRGLPHYTHLLGLHATRRAIGEGARLVEAAHVDSAIEVALQNTQQSTKSAYYKATMSQRKGSLRSQVLLACALAETDEMGYFAAVDVRGPLRKITGNRTYDTSNYAEHLREFCDEDRGSVLQKIGVSHRPRYRFRNPLMQPFVAMQGLVGGQVGVDLLGSAD